MNGRKSSSPTNIVVTNKIKRQQKKGGLIEIYVIKEDKVGDDHGSHYATQNGDRASQQAPFPVNHLRLLLLRVVDLSGFSLIIAGVLYSV